MSAISVIRFIIFGVIFVFSIICLGISANLLATAIEYEVTEVVPFSGCGIAVATLTLVILIPMFLIGLLQKGSGVSWVAVELGWTGLLWVLWLASAALSSSASANLFPVGDCSDLWPETDCSQYFALQAFQWLNWVFLFIYFVLVIILAIVASVRGNSRAWLGPVSNLTFSSTGTNNAESRIPLSGAYTGQQPYNINPAPGAYGVQPGSPMQQPGSYPGGQYQTPVHTGGYGVPGATGYAQPGQYGAPYGQHPHPNVAQV